MQGVAKITNRCGVVLGADASIGRVALAVLAPELEVIGRVHLHEETCPPILLLEPDGVGRPFAIQTPSLNKETVALHTQS